MKKEGVPRSKMGSGPGNEGPGGPRPQASPKPKHPKATLTESLTLLLFQGQDLAKPCERVSWGYLAPKTALNAHFPYPTARCSPRRKQRP